jgi:hypothetical protein
LIQPHFRATGKASLLIMPTINLPKKFGYLTMRGTPETWERHPAEKAPKPHSRSPSLDMQPVTSYLPLPT